MRWKSLAPVSFLIGVFVSAVAVSALGQVPAEKTGEVRNGTYENSFFGLTYTPASDLKFNTSELTAGKAYTERTFILFSAWEDQKPGAVRKGIVADADRLSDYSEGHRDVESYVNRVTRNQISQGYEVVGEKKQRQLGKLTFLEADFKRAPASEAILVTARDGYAIVLIFNASNPDDLDHLISTCQIVFADETKR